MLLNGLEENEESVSYWFRSTWSWCPPCGPSCSPRTWPSSRSCRSVRATRRPSPGAAWWRCDRSALREILQRVGSHKNVFQGSLTSTISGRLRCTDDSICASNPATRILQKFLKTNSECRNVGLTSGQHKETKDYFYYFFLLPYLALTLVRR